jgi:hypothetical protein
MCVWVLCGCVQRRCGYPPPRSVALCCAMGRRRVGRRPSPWRHMAGYYGYRYRPSGFHGRGIAGPRTPRVAVVCACGRLGKVQTCIGHRHPTDRGSAARARTDHGGTHSRRLACRSTRSCCSRTGNAYRDREERESKLYRVYGRYTRLVIGLGGAGGNLHRHHSPENTRLQWTGWDTSHNANGRADRRQTGGRRAEPGSRKEHGM